MATVEPRVNIALDANTLGIIKQIAKKSKTSMSKVCADFIRRKIEDDEDAYDIRMLNEMGDISKLETVTAEEMHRLLDEIQD